MSSETLSSAPLQLSSPSLLASPVAIQQSNPFTQLAEEFGLKEAEEVHTRLFMKTNSLRHQHEINAVHNHARASARGLLLKLQNLKSLGATAQQLRQAGQDTLKELETSSNSMMVSFERFQAGSRDLDNRYSLFDASASKPANPLTWAAFSEPSSSQTGTTSVFLNAIEKYRYQPQPEPVSVLATVIEKVNKIANVQPAQTQDAKKKVDDSVTASYQAFVRENTMQRAVAMRTAAATLNGIGTVIAFSAKSICIANPTNQQVCKTALEFGRFVKVKSKSVSKAALRAVGALDFIQKLRAAKPHALIHRLTELGIPSRLALQAEGLSEIVSAEGYIEDSDTISKAYGYGIAGGAVISLGKWAFGKFRSPAAIDVTSDSIKTSVTRPTPPEVYVLEPSQSKTVIFNIKQVDPRTSVAYVRLIKDELNTGTALETFRRLQNIGIEQGSERLLLQFSIDHTRIVNLLKRRFTYFGEIQNQYFPEIRSALLKTFEIPLKGKSEITIASKAALEAKVQPALNPPAVRRSKIITQFIEDESGTLRLPSRQNSLRLKGSSDVVQEASAELTALKVNRASEGYLYFPEMSDLYQLPLSELNKIWSRNHETLVGILARENIPRFGFHGTKKQGLEGIMKTRQSFSLKERDQIFLASYRYPLDPITQLSDLFTMVQKSAHYEMKGGATLIFDASSATSCRMPISLFPQRLLEIDSVSQKAFLELIGRNIPHLFTDVRLSGGTTKNGMIKSSLIENADEFLLHFTPENFDGVFRGVINRAETLYNPKRSFSLLNGEREVMTNRFKYQERIIMAFEQLEVLDFENAAWSRYNATGGELVSNIHEVTQIPREQIHAMNKEFFAQDGNNLRADFARMKARSKMPREWKEITASLKSEKGQA